MKQVRGPWAAGESHARDSAAGRPHGTRLGEWSVIVSKGQPLAAGAAFSKYRGMNTGCSGAQRRHGVWPRMEAVDVKKWTVSGYILENQRTGLSKDLGEESVRDRP